MLRTKTLSHSITLNTNLHGLLNSSKKNEGCNRNQYIRCISRISHNLFCCSVIRPSGMTLFLCFMCVYLVFCLLYSRLCKNLEAQNQQLCFNNYVLCEFYRVGDQNDFIVVLVLNFVHDFALHSHQTDAQTHKRDLICLLMFLSPDECEKQ